MKIHVHMPKYATGKDVGEAIVAAMREEERIRRSRERDEMPRAILSKATPTKQESER